MAKKKSDKYKPVKDLTARGALRMHGGLDSIWSNESRLSQRIEIAILERLEEQTAHLADISASIDLLNRRLASLEELEGVALAFKELQATLGCKGGK